MKWTMALAAGVLLAGVPAMAGELARSSFAADAGGQIGFLMPSNNVECIYTPAGGDATYMPQDGGPELSCDRMEPSYLRFTLGARGPAELIKNVGDQSCCGGTNHLAYGSEWRVAPFTCDSLTSGLVCARDDGHGFVISRAKISVY